MQLPANEHKFNAKFKKENTNTDQHAMAYCISTIRYVNLNRNLNRSILFIFLTLIRILRREASK